MNLIETFITQLGHSFAGINPAVIEMVKIFGVSIGWIGGLTYYMWRREKKKNARTAGL